MCDICVPTKRGALKVNGVIICHECIRFFENLGKINNRTTNEEINYQTLYIANQKIHNR